MKYSVALPSYIQDQSLEHLLRGDGQEDLCFALWNPSVGKSRTTALVNEILLPNAEERTVHGNASFLPGYFERAISLAILKKTGLMFMHSHLGPGWQRMSDNDINAELTHAASTMGATGLPLVGMTLGTDGSWSARFWEKTGSRTYEKMWCETVRVIGKSFSVTYCDNILPKPKFQKELERTVSAWGDNKQADLARLKVGIVGAGSVGSIIAEAIARMGIVDIKLIDFDSLETINLDRTLNATKEDIGKSKVEVLAKALRQNATAENFKVSSIEFSVVEKDGFREALDCDVLFSCVDRPWPRSVLNFIAYAHLIPVVDGGITVRVSKVKTLKGADWKAHIVTPTRKCLECLKQYDPGLVSAERDGWLDDPTYISSLPDEHPTRRNENVFAFSLSTASLQVLQFLSMVIAPLGVSDIGGQNYHFVIGSMDIEEGGMCNQTCPYPTLIALGDNTGFIVTGKHFKAEEARRARINKSDTISLMSIFKRGESRPFSNLVIEMRKSSRSYVWWIIIVGLIILLILFFVTRF